MFNVQRFSRRPAFSRAAFVACAAAAFFAAETSARADEPANAPAPSAPPASPGGGPLVDTPSFSAPKTEWYGWQTLTVDGAAFGAQFGGIATDKTAVFWAGASGYVLGAPVVHAAHGRWGVALADVGLRAGSVALGGAIGYALGGAGGTAMCPALDPRDAASPCWIQPSVVGLAVGMLVGAAVASAVDASVLARTTAPEKLAPSFSWAPSLSVAKGGGTAGVAGTF